jgi:hypothetical protein
LTSQAQRAAASQTRETKVRRSVITGFLFIDQSKRYMAQAALLSGASSFAELRPGSCDCVLMFKK